MSAEIRLTSKSDAKAISIFYQENSTHLGHWEPLRSDGFHSVDAWAQRLVEREEEQVAGRSAYFTSFDAETQGVIAICSLTNIVKGPFQACNMGYAISQSHQDKGLMKQLCLHVIDYAFNELELNRIMANYMPSNRRSENLLKNLGFEREGLAKKYLCINGKWEDHVLTSLINPRNT